MARDLVRGRGVRNRRPVSRSRAGTTTEGFTSKERDAATQLDYFGARYYMPALGRWTSMDPLADSFPAWNGYHYVEGNPVGLVDPFGQAPIPPVLARYLIGAGAGLLAEGAWQVYSGEFHGDRLITAGLVGALGGAASRIPGWGRAVGTGLLGAGATTLDGEIDVPAMIVGAVLGVTAEYAAQRLTSEVANQGVEAVRTTVFEHLEKMIQQGRRAEDVINAAIFFDHAVSGEARGAAVGTLAGLVQSLLSEAMDDGR